MSLNTMARRMSLEVPGLADRYAATLLGEALGQIEDSRLWSFQLAEGGWLTPGLLFPGGPGVSLGTVTVTPFSPIVVGDANATAAWAAYGMTMPLLTSLQFRSPFYSLYNIIGYGIGNGAGYGQPPYGTGGYGGSGFGTFLLDRPWMEPGGSQQSYMIYQAYFPVPVPDFKRFLAARDTTNSLPMDFWSRDQKELAFIDPERTEFDDPVYFVPYETDQRPGSSTFGNMMYELWPHPLDILPYTFSFMRRGPQLINPGDTVPFPLTEEAVLWRAKEAAFLFKEAQKGENVERGSGADFRFLSQAAHAQYLIELKACKDKDRGMVDLYFSKFRRDLYLTSEPYSNQDGSLNVGRM
jgi:hypothetical protein